MNEISARIANMPEEAVNRSLRDRGLSTRGSEELLRSRLFEAVIQEERPGTSGEKSARAPTPEPWSPIDRGHAGGLAESTRVNGLHFPGELPDTVPILQSSVRNNHSGVIGRSRDSGVRGTVNSNFNFRHDIPQAAGHSNFIGSGQLPYSVGAANFNLRPQENYMHSRGSGNFLGFPNLGGFASRDGFGQLGIPAGYFQPVPRLGPGFQAPDPNIPFAHPGVGEFPFPGFPNPRPDVRVQQVQNNYRLEEQRRMSTVFNVMSKWGLKFSGGGKEDSEEFLRKIRDGRQLLGLTDRELFDSLPFFLEGVALNWYRNSRWRWNDFREFEFFWRGRFTDPDFQFTLYLEIRNRTQHQKEKVSDFLTNLKCMFDRMDPQLEEDKQIDIAVRNMLPRFQIAFANIVFQNWAHLERIAARMERTYINAKNYKSPPSFEDSLLPQLAFQDPNPAPLPNPVNRKPRVPLGVHSNLNAVNLIEFSEEPLEDYQDNIDDSFEDYVFQLKSRPNANTTPRPPNYTEPQVRNRSNDRCYRCGEMGHYADVCSKPRRIFCRECGTYGVKRTECTKCPPLKSIDYCRKCGLTGVTTENCSECPGN